MSRLMIAVCAAALAGSACTMNNTEVPPVAGPSELALSLALYANPDVVPQDGASQSVVVIQARDQAGQAIKNLPLRFDLSVNNTVTSPGRLSAATANTDSDGRAAVTYTAPPASVGNVDSKSVVTVKVTPTGTDYANAAARTVDIRLAPSGGGSVGPVASFTYAPISPAPNTTVTFNGSASRSDVAIVSWLWDFGDGTAATGMSTQHVYRVAKDYTATLTVTDANGKTSNPVSDLVQVSEAAGSTPDFVFSPTAPTPFALINFDASISKAAPGRTIVDYQWNFGDGSAVRRGETITWSYAVAGSYAVTLRITDDLGRTFTVAKTVTVVTSDSTPDFVYSPASPVAGAPIFFDASISKVGAGRTIADYTWNFGDGTPAQTGITTTKTYTAAGIYSVTLRITDDFGKTFTTVKTVTVK